LGSTRLGQLLVWEWQSETYVLKQQGHLYGIQALDFASDGQLIATGGEDAKVKLWNASSGFCFVTFSEHVAPVTGVRFVGKGAGKAVLSCSLDGTVRAHDLLRYRNFRTLTTPQPAQFTSLAVDLSGEVVCAGAMDPFHIYVWSLQTGRLLDVLTGHEGPVACLDFSPTSSVLASGSWDGTLKLWDVYKNSCTETMEHGCDVLAVAFRPDGAEVVTAATNGNLHVGEVESGQQVGLIEGQRDITGGAVSTDKVSAANALRSKHFTTVAYTPDGQCVLAAGLSKFACVYAVASGALVKKFQLSYNRSLEGVVDNVRSDQYADGVPLAALGGDSDDEHHPYSALPGAGGGGRRAGADGSRSTRPEVVTGAVRFCPTGREWAAATTQGLQVFSLDDAMQFAPTDLDVAITPQSIRAAAARHEYGLAVNMALHLAEPAVLKEAVDAVPADSVELVVKSLDRRMLRAVLRFLAEEVAASRHVEYYLAWCWAVLRAHGAVLQADSLPHLESLRALIRAVGLHEKEVMRMSDENLFSLEFLATQGRANAAAAAAVRSSSSSSSVGGGGGGQGDGSVGDEEDGDDEDDEDDGAMDDDDGVEAVEIVIDTRKSAVRESLSSSAKKNRSRGR
jgi:periodic tryptophan protein 2